MNCEDLFTHISQFVITNEDEQSALKSVLISRPFTQGDLIVKSGAAAGYMMYVCSGYILTYVMGRDGLEHVVQIVPEGWWAPDLFSLTNQSCTTYTTKGLCKGNVLLFPRTAQSYIFDKYPVFESYFRIIFQESLIRQQSRFVEVFTMSAADRYEQYISDFPGIATYVPQKYIASYLGITPQFLSKIRGNKYYRKLK